MAWFFSVHVCVLMSYKDTSHTGSGPTRMTSFYCNHLFKGPRPKYTPVLRDWGLGLQPTHLGGGPQVGPWHLNAWELTTCIWPHILMTAAALHRVAVPSPGGCGFFFFFPSLQSQDQHNACVSGSFSVPDLAPGYKINRRLLPWCKMPVLKWHGFVFFR